MYLYFLFFYFYISLDYNFHHLSTVILSRFEDFWTLPLFRLNVVPKILFFKVCDLINISSLVNFITGKYLTSERRTPEERVSCSKPMFFVKVARTSNHINNSVEWVFPFFFFCTRHSTVYLIMDSWNVYVLTSLELFWDCKYKGEDDWTSILCERKTPMN